MSSILNELRWRGMVASTTDEATLDSVLSEGPVTFYVGFDPSAPSLQIGNMAQLVTARRLQEAGHRPIMLVGGSTGLIGDPKPDAERTLNDPELVAGWVAKIKEQVQPFVSFEGPNAATVVNNLDWTADLSVIEFLRDVGSHFRVNKMIQKEAVSARLHSELGIGYAEFSYQILQAYDYLVLHREYGCVLQLGGSDQWGNITAGVDLIRRVEGASVHALATPLLTDTNGRKLGKTETGTIWLSGEMLSPYAFYQYLYNTEDASVGKYLRAFSMRARDEIEELEKLTAERPAAREAQRALAEELTTMVHGAAECANVVAASQALFGRGELRQIPAGTLSAALRETPHAEVNRETDGKLPTVVELMAATGLVHSKSAARRAVEEGGAYVNNQRVDDVDARPGEQDLLADGWLVLRRGRRSVAGAMITDHALGSA